MKKIINTRLLAAFAFILVMSGSCSSCKQPTPPAPNTPPGSLIFHLHTLVGNVEDSDSTHMVLKNADGINMRLYFSNMFISNIRLITAAGDTVAPLTDTVVLKHWDEETYPLGAVPAGNYKFVKFDVGLPSKINHTNPATYPSSEPYSDLNAFWYGSKTEMWPGNTTNGYTFAYIKGVIDTSKTGNGTPTQPFSYQIGGDNIRTTITMPEQDFTVVSGVPTLVHMVIDFGYFLHGLNLKTQNTGNFVSNPALIQQMAKNITAYPAIGDSLQPYMFKYEWGE